MRTIQRTIFPLLCFLFLVACASAEPVAEPGGHESPAPSGVEPSAALPAAPLREPLGLVYTPVADGSLVFSSDYVVIDYSNSAEGYVMVQYIGSSTGKVKFQLSDASGTVYTYDLHDRSGYQVFFLHAGSGNYTLQTFEQASGNEYYTVDTQTLTAEVTSDTLPYLYPNQYVNFEESTVAVAEARELYAHTETDLDFISAVFSLTMERLDYDHDKAELAVSGALAGYLPDIDATLASGTGICFDYAAVMAAMLRSQGVPTRLVIGYAGDVYHAWISVHTEETGWIENIIEFDGTKWKIMDPTFADGGADASFLGDGTNYAETYIY